MKNVKIEKKFWEKIDKNILNILKVRKNEGKNWEAKIEGKNWGENLREKMRKSLKIGKIFEFKMFTADPQ